MRKEIPLLLNTDVIDPVLKQIKGFTRRPVVTTQNGWDCQKMDLTHIQQIKEEELGVKYKNTSKQLVGIHAYFKDAEHGPHQLGTLCPFGMEGDWIWVREEHNIWRQGEYWMCKFMDGQVICRHDDKLDEKTRANLIGRKTLGQWQRARFLPKVFSRIWLERTTTDVKRLQTITPEEALQEGIERIPAKGQDNQVYQFYKNYLYEGVATPSPVESFFSLWDSLYGKDSHKTDPWVWILGFKLISSNGRPKGN